MDLLSNVLLSLKVESTVISEWRLSAPWGVDIRDFSPGFCMTLIEGYCWFYAPGHPPQKLSRGDTLLAPRGGVCALASAPDSALASLSEVWQQPTFEGLDTEHRPSAPVRVEWGAGGEETQLLGLAFTFQGRGRNLLLDVLPEFIVLRSVDNGVFPGVESAVALLQAEREETKPGYFAVAKLLAEMTFVSLLRAFIQSEPHHPIGWLRGLGDEKVAKALEAMHAKPASPWTVPVLASTAGMSRSAFAARFTHLVGQPPIEYLISWRVQLASELLSATRHPIPVIAQMLGFQSDRVFRQAFKQRAGVSPLNHRKHGATPAETIPETG
ncbi:transcriptional regulator containing an amidase domain and an AraC-type DNA-binding HTH domain [Pseudomonas sp. GM21]|uniref:AraC family transcriptional regulator n=1 Tax=Pseudomonas sp. GM21 TaxID=1144325 RepID=UPI0002725914|nr:AraC family transcriptional regulator [Pseudomonas sp. GM21]EJM22924.1 transcriptional regulator containing an amidase domain and an AraC-type DNA-binding HTH domain [Pseudomonas sp. GM21]